MFLEIKKVIMIITIIHKHGNHKNWEEGGGGLSKNIQRSTKNIYEIFAKSIIHTTRCSIICQWPIQRTTSTYKDPSDINHPNHYCSFHSPPSCATLKHFHSGGKIICTTSTIFNPSGFPSKYHPAFMALLLHPQVLCLFK